MITQDSLSKIVTLGGQLFEVLYHCENPADDGAWSSDDVGCIGRGQPAPAPYIVIDDIIHDSTGEIWTDFLSDMAKGFLKEELK